MSYQEHREILFSLANDSIRHGLDYGKPIQININQLHPDLIVEGASFVTLEKHGQLRGCIGSIDACRPLAEDITHNAWAAAFQDPRFDRLQETELNELDIFISILSKPETIDFTSEQDLLKQIRPEIDGLIIEAAGRRGTFLPSVWESLPDKKSFLSHLKMKAGLPQNYWSEELKISRYITEYIV